MPARIVIGCLVDEGLHPRSVLASSALTSRSTDDFGSAAVENQVHVHDFHATILHLLGFDHTLLTSIHGGREMRLTDVHGRVIRGFLA